MQTPCTHPPARLFAWFAYDGTLCMACCDCGNVLTGAARLPATAKPNDSSAPNGSSASNRSLAPNTPALPQEMHPCPARSQP